MGVVSDTILDLEESGVIVFSTKLNTFVLAGVEDPEPFDLSEYLYNIHKSEADEADAAELTATVGEIDETT